MNIFVPSKKFSKQNADNDERGKASKQVIQFFAGHFKGGLSTISLLSISAAHMNHEVQQKWENGSSLLCQSKFQLVDREQKLQLCHVQVDTSPFI